MGEDGGPDLDGQAGAEILAAFEQGEGFPALAGDRQGESLAVGGALTLELRGGLPGQLDGLRLVPCSRARMARASRLSAAVPFSPSFSRRARASS